MNCCVLVAGMPASGKTTFAEHAAQELQLPVISKDRIKELLYDSVGFRSHTEKVALSVAATSLLYYYAESVMRVGTEFILENNFENVSKPGLEKLLDAYTYQAVTVRFGGDMQVIYQRYLQREKGLERHGGHKTKDAWPHPQQTGVLSAPMPMEEFFAGVVERGIAEFSVGKHEIYVDTTDYSQVSYADIVEQLRALMRQVKHADETNHHGVG